MPKPKQKDPAYVFSLDVHESDDAVLECDRFVFWIDRLRAQEMLAAMDRVKKAGFWKGETFDYRGFWIKNEIEYIDDPVEFSRQMKEDPKHGFVQCVLCEVGEREELDPEVAEAAYLSLDGNCCCVTDDDVWFTATYKHSSVEISTSQISRRTLEIIVNGDRPPEALSQPDAETRIIATF